MGNSIIPNLAILSSSVINCGLVVVIVVLHVCYGHQYHSLAHMQMCIYGVKQQHETDQEAKLGPIAAAMTEQGAD